MAIKPYIRRNNLIQRYSVPFYHRIVKGDESDNPFDDVIPTIETITEEGKFCTIQNAKKNKFITDLSGLSTEEFFVIYTQTPMYQPIKGTGDLGSGVYIPDSFFGVTSSPFGIRKGVGGWYNAVEVYPYANNVIPHYMCLLVKDTTAKDNEYPTAQKDASLPYMSTLAEFKSGAWVATWMGK